jgi:hypothetical protein
VGYLFGILKYIISLPEQEKDTILLDFSVSLKVNNKFENV